MPKSLQNAGLLLLIFSFSQARQRKRVPISEVVQTDMTHEAPLRGSARRGGQTRWQGHFLTLRFAPEIMRIILGHSMQLRLYLIL